MVKNPIYHYTNLYAFKNIIESGELWFTRIDSLNDYSEFNYYKEVFQKARTEFILEREIKDRYDLGLINLWVDEHLLGIRDLHYKKTFTFSFSNHGDSIPLWNYYSAKLGLAIGFNKELLIKAIRDKVNDYYAFSECNIEYNVDNQYKLIKSRLAYILETANKPEFMHSDIQNTLNAINNKFGEMWVESYAFKDQSFEYEKEFRIVLCDISTKKRNDMLHKIHSEITGNTIKPVIKIKVTDSWNDLITNIMISPYNRSEIVVDNISEFLDRNGVYVDKNMITKSNCPIRDF